MDALPNEVLRLIFRQVFFCCWGTILRTCKRWRRVGKSVFDPSCWCFWIAPILAKLTKDRAILCLTELLTYPRVESNLTAFLGGMCEVDLGVVEHIADTFLCDSRLDLRRYGIGNMIYYIAMKRGRQDLYDLLKKRGFEAKLSHHYMKRRWRKLERSQQK